MPLRFENGLDAANNARDLTMQHENTENSIIYQDYYLLPRGFYDSRHKLGEPLNQTYHTGRAELHLNNMYVYKEGQRIKILDEMVHKFLHQIDRRTCVP